MQKNLIIGICVVAVCLFVCVSYSSALNGQKIEKVSSLMFRGNTLYVGGSGPGNYSSIQDAVNASSDGDTVFVFQGSYYGKVVINKSISLLGENASRTFINWSIEPDWYQHVVLICSHNVLFSGFTVVLEQGDSIALRLNDSRNCTISHNIFKASWGILLHNSSYTIIENNSFFTIVTGIDLRTSSYNDIIHNWFTNEGDYPNHLVNCGIYIDVNPGENVISDNYFYHCSDYAIRSYSPYRNIIERNVFQQGGIEIYLVLI